MILESRESAVVRAPDPQQQFMQAFRGSFTSALRWHHLDDLWQRMNERVGEGWYIYAIGEEPPERPADATQVTVFIGEIDRLLRKEHEEDYCGIVYADNLQVPNFVKIYDPHNLGSVCGPGFGPPPFPGWILSTLPPADLNIAFPPPASRRRWWQRIFG